MKRKSKSKSSPRPTQTQVKRSYPGSTKNTYWQFVIHPFWIDEELEKTFPVGRLSKKNKDRICAWYKSQLDENKGLLGERIVNVKIDNKTGNITIIFGGNSKKYINTYSPKEWAETIAISLANPDEDKDSPVTISLGKNKKNVFIRGKIKNLKKYLEKHLKRKLNL